MCELKIDGFKIVLTYENGLLQTAATRGDGVTGEDVTQNIKTVESVPLKLEKPVSIVVEGEIWMSKREFERLNKEQKKKICRFCQSAQRRRRLHPAVGSVCGTSRKLDSYIYDIALINKNNIPLSETQIKELESLELKELGFKVNKNYKLCQNISEVIAYWKEWQKKKTKKIIG